MKRLISLNSSDNKEIKNTTINKESNLQKYIHFIDEYFFLCKLIDSNTKIYIDFDVHYVESKIILSCNQNFFSIDEYDSYFIESLKHFIHTPNNDVKSHLQKLTPTIMKNFLTQENQLCFLETDIDENTTINQSDYETHFQFSKLNENYILEITLTKET